MADYKGCDLHPKAFPANMIDLSQHTMTKLYLERKEKKDGKDVTLSLFIGNNADEGADICPQCLQDQVIAHLTGLGIKFSWKVVTWYKEQVAKRDGSGTYEKLQKRVESAEEYTERLAQEKAKALAQAQTPKVN